MNITITVPNNSSNHGDPNLLCAPPAWSDYLTFFFGNYFAHAASIILEPGVGFRRTLVLIFAALTLPGSGIDRAISTIWRHSIFYRKSPLRQAARARALCMVMKVPEEGVFANVVHLQRGYTFRNWWAWFRGSWHNYRNNVEGRPVKKTLQEKTGNKSNQGEVQESNYERSISNKGHRTIRQIYNAIRRATNEKYASDKLSIRQWWATETGYEPVPEHCTVYGEFWLHEDYYLAIVPPFAKLDFAQEPDDANFMVAKDSKITHNRTLLISSYSVPKLLISLIQAIWGIVTIYNARGDQIEQYGYAAFGLTVVPFVFMSFLNGIANLLNPSYPTMFLIRTPAMDQAEREQKGRFRSAIEVQLFELTTSQSKNRSIFTGMLKFYVTFVVSAIPVAIVAALTHFQIGASTQLQRGFTMSWLVIGMFYGSSLKFFLQYLRPKSKKASTLESTVNQSMNTTTGIFDANLENPAPDLWLLRFLILLSIPAIGGMVVVGLMIRDYGVCTVI